MAAKSGSLALPSIRQVKTSREKVLAVAGTSPCHHNGRYINDQNNLDRQEFANPLVRPSLEVYPQDAGMQMKHPRQAKKWAHEVDPNLAALMARSDELGKDFFVNELAMANIDHLGTTGLVVPTRWFHRQDGTLWSKACPVDVRETPDGAQLVVDMRQTAALQLPLTAYFLNIEDLLDYDVQRRYNIPSPESLSGVLCSDDPRTPIDLWRHPLRNEWRVRGNGRRVYGLPTWLYCDDTSGNVSKKWNKHNSILFVLGGVELGA
ncbi:hypothetical protein BV20DRAFT_1058313 [Pilatotrama ljubarskyi]|nr:hypothetical protein BV20DRAFT_1058313 [Pilatotrama ljubarskyi]